MVCGLIVVIPIMLTLIDLVLITLAQQVNDNAAREADRIAAAGDPAQAQSRAQQVINRINAGTAGYVSNVTLKALTFTPSNLLTTEAGLIPYGGLIQGSVTVNTTVTVNPIAVSFFHNGPFVFQAQQTCPVTFNVPNTAGGQPVPP